MYDTKYCLDTHYLLLVMATTTSILSQLLLTDSRISKAARTVHLIDVAFFAHFFININTLLYYYYIILLIYLVAILNITLTDF